MKAQKQSPSEGRMGFGNYAMVSSLENKPEAEAHRARQLSSQRLIKARIPGDTSIGETCQDLIGQSAIEYGSERVQFSDTCRSAGNAKVRRRQRIRRDLCPDADDVVLIERIGQIDVELQRPASILGYGDRVRQL